MSAQSLSLRVFGSAARGDYDSDSDTDILAINANKLSDRAIADLLVDEQFTNISISRYSEDTLRRMFLDGHLFAWHLWKESKKLNSSHDLLDEIGAPAPYRESSNDIARFRRLLVDVPESVRLAPGNSTYEAGLLFLSARNIAMSASWFCRNGPYFGRMSPYDLEKETSIDFPLRREDYLANMRARALGHRGEIVPILASNSVLSMLSMLLVWASEIAQYVEGKERRA